MKFLTILLLIGTVHNKVNGKPCLSRCDTGRFKRSQFSPVSNTRPNELPPQLSTNLPSTNVQINHENIKPEYIIKPITNQSEYNNPEVVGNAGLARIRALTAQARARAAVQRARARARIHRPLLLEATPEEYLHDDEKNFKVPDSKVPSSLLQLSSAIPIQNDESGHNKILQPFQDTSFTDIHQDKNLHIDTVKNYLNLPQARSNQETHNKTDDGRPTSKTAERAKYAVYRYEDNEGQFPPLSYSDVLVEDLPEIYVHNVDTNKEIYDNQKPTFSIIPTHCKPPSESNLYFQSQYEQSDGQEPILTILPGQWKDNDDDYNTYYYKDYDVIPISYNIPDSYYGRSSKSENEILGTFHGHGHYYGIHGRPIKHQVQYHASSYDQPATYISGYPSSKQYGVFNEHIPVEHTYAEISPLHGHQLTINKQLTTVVVPPNGHQNVQISQVAGNHNAVSQSQSSHNVHVNDLVHPGFLPLSNHNFQSSLIHGNQNSASQSQVFHARSANRESDQLVRSPNLVNFSRFSQHWSDEPLSFMKKRSISTQSEEIDKNVSNILLKQKELLNEIKNSKKYDKDLLFITEIGSNILDELGELKKHHLIKKRTIPLLRLIADPNAKLDVPKTLENAGTVVRRSFENKHAPMYHVKNAFGSTKDLFLSVLRILPQNLIIPSRYKIIDRERESNEIARTSEKKEEAVTAVNPPLISRARGRARARLFNNKIKENHDSPKVFLKRSESSVDSFDDTYKRVGTMLRESVRSGQDVLNHAGEVYHSARKALATSRLAAPRVILSSLRIPAVQRPSPLLFVTPKIAQLKQESVGAPHYSDNFKEFVGVEHVLNSLGFSNPNAEKVDMTRIVLQPADFKVQNNKLRETPNSVQNNNLEKLKKYFVLKDTIKQDDSGEDINETLLALENARETVGASNLKDFILQMKNGFTSLLKDSLDIAKENAKFKKLKGKVSVESHGKPPTKLKFQFEEPPLKIPKRQKFLPQEQNKTGFNVGKKQVVNDEPTAKSPVVENQVNNKTTTDEIVGAGLLLPRQLLKPFMGRPSKNERRKFFEDFGDSIELNEENQLDSPKPTNQNKVRSKAEVLGAINPILFNLSSNNSYEDPALNYLAQHFREHTKNTSSKNATNPVVINKIKEKKIDNSTTDKAGQDITSANEETTDGRIFTIMYNTYNNESAPDYSVQNYSVTHKKFQRVINESKFETNATNITEVTVGKAMSFPNETTMNKKNVNDSDSVGTSMKMGKALLTPFMGKLVKKEYIKLDGYDNNSEELQYVGKTNNKEADIKTDNYTTQYGYSSRQNFKLSRKAITNDKRNIINNQLPENII